MGLLSLAVACSHLVQPAMTLRVIDVESGGDPYAIHDNSRGVTYHPGSAPEAAQLTASLVRQGHRVDLGLMQINYEVWVKPAALSLADAFDPCSNIWLGTTILSSEYAAVMPRARNASEAVYRALSRYNSGSDWGSISYARRVLRGELSAERGGTRTGSTSFGLGR